MSGVNGLPWRKETRAHEAAYPVAIMDAQGNEIAAPLMDREADRILAAVNRPDGQVERVKELALGVLSGLERIHALETELTLARSTIEARDAELKRAREAKGGAFTRVTHTTGSGTSFIALGFDDMSIDPKHKVAINPVISTEGSHIDFVRSVPDRKLPENTTHSLEFRDGKYHLGPEIKPEPEKPAWPEKIHGCKVTPKAGGVTVGTVRVGLHTLHALRKHDDLTVGLALNWKAKRDRDVISVWLNSPSFAAYKEIFTLAQLDALIAACEACKKGAES